MNLLSVYNSIVKTGGATYNLYTGEFNPDSGYGVAQKGFEHVFDFYQNPNIFSEQVRSYLKHGILDQIYNRSDIYLGFWLNEGKIYFDIVERIPYLETAIAEGKRNEQKAIRDFANNVDIWLDKPTTKVSNDPDLEFDRKH